MNIHMDPEDAEHNPQSDYYRKLDEHSTERIQQDFLKNASLCLSNPDARFSRGARFALSLYKLFFLSKQK